MNFTNATQVISFCVLFIGLTLSAPSYAAKVKFNKLINQKTADKLINDIQNKLKDGDTTLRLELGSDGGEMPHAIRIADYLRSLKNEGVLVETRNNSLCGSACTIIYAAGEIRSARSSAQFYFHTVGVQGAGDKHDSVQLIWAHKWLSEIALVDPKLSMELEESKIMITKKAERYYTTRELIRGGYSYVNRL